MRKEKQHGGGKKGRWVKRQLKIYKQKVKHGYEIVLSYAGMTKTKKWRTMEMISVCKEKPVATLLTKDSEKGVFQVKTGNKSKPVYVFQPLEKSTMLVIEAKNWVKTISKARKTCKQLA